MEYKVQVPKEHYSTERYDSVYRFISYCNQKDAILKACKSRSSSILEVGIGNGLVTDYLKNRGFNVQTFDFDEALKPDYVGDVLHISTVVHQTYEVVACFEILEHIQYQDVEVALEELAKIARSYLLISVPQLRLSFSFWTQLATIPPLMGMLSVPLPIPHRFDGQHYWELGKAGYSLSGFRKLLKKHFVLIEEYTHPLDTYHRFFVLRTHRNI